MKTIRLILKKPAQKKGGTLHILICFLLLSLTNISQAQDDKTMKKKAYHLMINSLIGHTVPESKVDSSYHENVIWLDAREKNEFKVSHIPDAVFVGYNQFNLNSVKNIPKEAEIVVYCSVGYRSEKVAEKLIAAGYTNVSNLYGGIFEWCNQSRPLVDKNNETVNQVHGYDKTWGIWVNDGKAVY